MRWIALTDPAALDDRNPRRLANAGEIAEGDPDGSYRADPTRCEISRAVTWRDHLVTIAKSSVGSVVCIVVEIGLLHLSSSNGVPVVVCFAGVQVVGTTITFTFNKYWAFDAACSGRLAEESTKSLAVFGGSLALNTALPSLFSYGMHAAPVVAFLASQVLVYVAWNFPLNRWWVFREQRTEPED